MHDAQETQINAKTVSTSVGLTVSDCDAFCGLPLKHLFALNKIIIIIIISLSLSLSRTHEIPQMLHMPLPKLEKHKCMMRKKHR